MSQSPGGPAPEELKAALKAFKKRLKLTRQWLHAPNHHLGGIPAERIRTVTGLVDAIEYLDAMRGKV